MYENFYGIPWDHSITMKHRGIPMKYCGMYFMENSICKPMNSPWNTMVTVEWRGVSWDSMHSMKIARVNPRKLPRNTMGHTMTMEHHGIPVKCYMGFHVHHGYSICKPWCLPWNVMWSRYDMEYYVVCDRHTARKWTVDKLNTSFLKAHFHTPMTCFESQLSRKLFATQKKNGFLRQTRQFDLPISNGMAALSIPRLKIWLTSTARVPCSKAVNIYFMTYFYAPISTIVSAVL